MTKAIFHQNSSAVSAFGAVSRLAPTFLRRVTPTYRSAHSQSVTDSHATCYLPFALVTALAGPDKRLYGASCDTRYPIHTGSIRYCTPTQHSYTHTQNTNSRSPACCTIAHTVTTVKRNAMYIYTHVHVSPSVGHSLLPPLLPRLQPIYILRGRCHPTTANLQASYTPRLVLDHQRDGASLRSLAERGSGRCSDQIVT